MAFDWSPTYNQAKSSIFFVFLTPIEDEAEVLAMERKSLADNVKTKIRGKEMTNALFGCPTSTGFCVDVRGDEITIITTAHSVDHLFTASNPITPAQVNRLFRVQVLCGHYESAYAQAKSEEERTYANARVVAMNCATDLMLLTARLSDVRGYAAGGGGPCHEPHPPMVRCATIGETAQECLMLSWPPYKPNMLSIGRIGARRIVDDISRPNKVEYDMDLLEVQMGSGQGSSGAPLLNERGEVFGMLHGGHGGGQSYFICPWHIIEFLENNIGNPPPPPPPGAGVSCSKRLKLG